MKSLRTVVFIFIMMVIAGCYHGINGKVVDNATGKPLEGALVVVQWTRPDIHSIEGISSAVIMNTETLTDKEGGFVIRSTPSNPFANPPRMIIIKEGYIPWRNDEIFPGGHIDKDKKWKNNETYKLDVFTDKYSYNQVDFFLFLQSGGNEVPMFEALKNRLSSVQRQRANTLIQVDFNGKVVDAKTNDPIEDAIILAIDNDPVGDRPEVKTVTEGISDKEGNVRISGKFHILEYPPHIIVYKKGYFAQSSYSRPSVYVNTKELNRFTWPNGYVFKMNTWDPWYPHNLHFEFIKAFAEKASKEGKPKLLESIMWEKDAK